MENSYFLNIDESIAVCSSMSDSDKKEKFKHAYFKSMSGALLIRKADGSDFTTNFDKRFMEMVEYAVPKSFKVKKVTTVKNEEVIEILGEDYIRSKYPDIAEEAFTLGCQEYNDDDFIHHEICREMWKMGVELKTVTGWAYYAYTVRGNKSNKKAIVPIRARPLLSKNFNSSIYNITMYSEVYLKSDFVELSDINLFSLRKMPERYIKKMINELVLKQDHYDCIKIISTDGKNTKAMFVYYDSKISKTVTEIKKLLQDKVLNFNFEKYIVDNGNRLILNESDSNSLLSELSEYLNITKL